MLSGLPLFWIHPRVNFTVITCALHQSRTQSCSRCPHPQPHHHHHQHHRRCSTAFTATLMKTADEERHSYLKARREGRAEISRPATYVTPSNGAILSRTSRTKFIPRTETIKWGAIKGVIHTWQVLTYITNKYALFAVTSTPTLSGWHNVTVFPIKVWDFSTIIGGCSGAMRTINTTGASWYDYSLRNFVSDQIRTQKQPGHLRQERPSMNLCRKISEGESNWDTWAPMAR